MQPSEEFEEAAAAFGGILGGAGGVEREAEVDHRDVDGVGLDEVGGLAAGAGAEGLDAHGLEEAGELVDPGLGTPAGIREEEVEAAGVGAGGRETGVGPRVVGVERVMGVVAHRHHRAGAEAKGMPGARCAQSAYLQGVTAYGGGGCSGVAATRLGEWRRGCQDGRQKVGG